MSGTNFFFFGVKTREMKGIERELVQHAWYVLKPNHSRWETSFSEQTKPMDLVFAAWAVGI
jgi:hypothetical protein